MSQNKDSGIMEIIAIGAIVFFMWKVTRKKMTIPVSEEELTIEETCKNIVYKPLSPMEPRQATLLGKGYCYSGDLKYSDYSQGSGDPYADQQAEEYTERKNEEAIRDINRKVIQFRLINTSAVAITTKVLDTIQDSVPFSPIPSAPVANSATGITSSGFTANWSAVSLATGYYLDVATDSAFTSYVSGYQNKDVSNVASYAITGLSDNTNYYFRLRAYNSSGLSSNSATVTVKTIPISCSNWFLPSEDELDLIYDNLVAYGYGDYDPTNHWSSTEVSATVVRVVDFSTGTHYNNLKGNGLGTGTINIFLACRTFVTSTIYNIRDTGAGGGLIFYVINNGDGTYTYYEATADDVTATPVEWSNIFNIEIGASAQGTAIGTGITNTNAIIAQAGHTDSAANECYNYTA
jgi:hypothetical protein